MATVNGSLECVKDTGENMSFAVVDFDSANVALFALSLFQASGLVAVDPPNFIPPGQETVPSTIVGQWSATTADQRPATVLLHQTPDFDTTLLGRWLATQGQGG